jgi:hypothetical protein
MRRVVLLACCGALLTVGCGGSGSDDPDLTITSVPAFDGFITNTGFADVSTSSSIAAGDTDGSFGNVARGLVRFDRSALPAGATIKHAVLRMNQAAVAGSPYGSPGGLGSVLVDHVDLGSSIDLADFGGGILTATIGTLSSTAALGERSLDVTAAVQADASAARATSDFRLYFTVNSNANAADDFVTFNDAENHLGGSVPVLVVTYSLP